MTTAKIANFLSFTTLLAVLAIAAFIPSPAVAQEGIAVELPCVTGVTAYPLGQAVPEDLGGGFTAHTHPGTLVVSIEAGTLELTQLEHSGMEIVRADGSTETMEMGTPLTLNAGDWFVEPEGMVHTAFNTGDEPAVVLLTGVVDPNLPLVQCVEGTPAA
jgi:hypothetical protein